MKSAHRPRGSLARSTLTKMGVRVAVIIALASLFSYLHIFDVFLTQALVQLERGVIRHSQREQQLFLQAESNHVLLKQAFEERLRALSQQDPQPRFDSLFVAGPDGTLHNRPESFDGTRMPGVFAVKDVPQDATFRRRLLAAYDVVAQYGPAFHVNFTNTYMSLPEGVFVLYWPEHPTWCQDVGSTFTTAELELINSSLERNPQRQMNWTPVLVEPLGIALVTLVDMEGRHVATLFHDILAEELNARAANDHLPGAYNLIFSDDGRLLVHPDLRMKIGAKAYNILNDPRPPEEIFERVMTAEQRAHLRVLFERVKGRAPGQTVLEVPESGEYLAVARLKGPDLNFVTVLPRRIVSSDALAAARYVLGFGLVSLVMELLIMSWVLRQQISRPLLVFTQATDQVATGDFHVSFKNPRDDELGRLGQGFELMAHELQQREAALRLANEGLESRIEERTGELQEKNLKLERTLTQLEEARDLLVEKERLASLGTLMAGIAHELKNPLNFVINFAQNSMSLVEDLREELKGQQEDPDGSWLERMEELLEWLRQNVGEIDGHGKRADSILRNMQMHSHVRAGERRPTDLNALLEEQLSLFSQGIQVTNPGLEVTLREDLAPDLSRVDVVSQDFGRALLNILNNSLYALAEKKREAGKGFTPELTVSSRSVGDRVEIRIRDNGTGIPRKHQDKIFSPFFTTKPAGVGTGLGLSITYDIVVRQHQGELRIDSSEGEYTECILLLPSHEEVREEL